MASPIPDDPVWTKSMMNTGFEILHFLHNVEKLKFHDCKEHVFTCKVCSLHMVHLVADPDCIEEALEVNKGGETEIFFWLFRHYFWRDRGAGGGLLCWICY